jgi:hypothetical protein
VLPGRQGCGRERPDGRDGGNGCGSRTGPAIPRAPPPARGSTTSTGVGTGGWVSHYRPELARHVDVLGATAARTLSALLGISRSTRYRKLQTAGMDLENTGY